MIFKTTKWDFDKDKLVDGGKYELNDGSRVVIHFTRGSYYDFSVRGSNGFWYHENGIFGGDDKTHPLSVKRKL